MKRTLVITLTVLMLVVIVAAPSMSEAWHRHSAVIVAGGPAFYGFPVGFGYTAFSRHSTVNIGISGFWPGYYYPYYTAPVYYPAPVYYGPVYYERRYYRGRYDDDWVRSAEEFLRGGK